MKRHSHDAALAPVPTALHGLALRFQADEEDAVSQDGLFFVAGAVFGLLALMAKDTAADSGSGQSLFMAVLCTALSAFMFWLVLS